MKKSLLLSVAAIGALASCKKSNDSNPNLAKVMFINGAINAPSLDAAANNTKINGATNINFGDRKGYVTVATGDQVNVSFITNATSSAFLNQNLKLDGNKYYTVFAGGDAFNNKAMVVSTDDLSAPVSGKAKIRFVNLSPGSLKESLYIGSTKLDSNISFSGITPFIEVAAGSSQILVQDPANPTQLPTISESTNGNLTFNSGKIYTLVLTGTPGGSGTGALTVKAYNNN